MVALSEWAKTTPRRVAADNCRQKCDASRPAVRAPATPVNPSRTRRDDVSRKHFCETRAAHGQTTTNHPPRRAAPDSPAARRADFIIPHNSSSHCLIRPPSPVRCDPPGTNISSTLQSIPSLQPSLPPPAAPEPRVCIPVHRNHPLSLPDLFLLGTGSVISLPLTIHSSRIDAFGPPSSAQARPEEPGTPGSRAPLSPTASRPGQTLSSFPPCPPSHVMTKAAATLRPHSALLIASIERAWPSGWKLPENCLWHAWLSASHIAPSAPTFSKGDERHIRDVAVPTTDTRTATRTD